MALAMSSGRSGSTSGPASPTTSGSDPRFAATTGTPSDIASSTGRPNPSSNEGRTSRRAPSVERLALRGLDVADIAHGAFERRALDPFEPRSRLVGRLAREHEFGRRRCRCAVVVRLAMPHQPLVRVEQPADVLARLERAEEQHVAVFRRGRARRPVGGAGRAHGNAIARARRARAPLRRRRTPTTRRPRPPGSRDRARAPGSRGGSRRACARDATENSGRESSPPGPRSATAAAADARNASRRTAAARAVPTGGHPRRCHARFSRRTGMRRSTTRAPASSAAGVEPVLP